MHPDLRSKKSHRLGRSPLGIGALATALTAGACAIPASSSASTLATSKAMLPAPTAAVSAAMAYLRTRTSLPLVAPTWLYPLPAQSSQGLPLTLAAEVQSRETSYSVDLGYVTSPTKVNSPTLKISLATTYASFSVGRYSSHGKAVTAVKSTAARTDEPSCLQNCSVQRKSLLLTDGQHAIETVTKPTKAESGPPFVSIGWKAGSWTYSIGADLLASNVVSDADALIEEVHAHPLPTTSAGLVYAGKGADAGTSTVTWVEEARVEQVDGSFGVLPQIAHMASSMMPYRG